MNILSLVKKFFKLLLPIALQVELIKAKTRIKGYELNKERKDVLHRFQNQTSLLQENYDRLIINAKNKKLQFSAEFAQDIMAYLFFNAKPNGFYIEIGANDGYNGSTTYWAQQLGWKGICVEPLKRTFQYLKKYRKCALYNFAISDNVQGNIKFNVFPQWTTRSGFANTMSVQQIETAKKLSGMKTLTVNTMTFNDMMKKFPDITHIDFMSIDTEGHELNVLRSIDFDKYSFGLIAIETQEDSEVVEFVKKKGYKILLTAVSDVIFVPKEYKITGG